MSGDPILLGVGEEGIHICDAQTTARPLLCRLGWALPGLGVELDLQRGVGERSDLKLGLTGRSSPWGDVFVGKGAFVQDGEAEFASRLTDDGTNLIWESPEQKFVLWYPPSVVRSELVILTGSCNCWTLLSDC